MSTAPETRALVAVEHVDGDVRGAVRRALEAVDFRSVLPRGEPVALKVNLGWDMFLPGSITSPLVAESLILELRDHVGPIYVVESDQVLEDIEKAFRDSGMAAVCRRTGAQWVNMDRADKVTIEAPDNIVLKTIEVPRILREAHLVTVPVMKTHAKTVITGALKNQWGCISKLRHEHHLVIDDALADLNAVIRPELCLMDATVGLAGNGPKSGHPQIADRILCSTDPVALDTIQAELMGIDPRTIEHIRRSAVRGTGIADRARIDLRGEPRAKAVVAFAPARHNAVSVVETLLRRSFVKRLFFNTPIFSVCLFGAKWYYRVWTALHAKAHWQRIRSHPVYGPQWSASWPGVEPRRAA